MKLLRTFAKKIFYVGELAEVDVYERYKTYAGLNQIPYNAYTWSDYIKGIQEERVYASIYTSFMLLLRYDSQQAIIHTKGKSFNSEATIGVRIALLSVKSNTHSLHKILSFSCQLMKYALSKNYDDAIPKCNGIVARCWKSIY